MTMTTPESPDRGWESLVIRFENDKIVEYWSICDRVLLQSQAPYLHPQQLLEGEVAGVVDALR